MTKPTRQDDCAPSEDSDQTDQSLRCTLSGVAKDPRFLHVDSKDSDQTGRMPRLRPVLSESSLGAQSFGWFCHEAAQKMTQGFSGCVSFTTSPGSKALPLLC